jgi:hypothetical protein
MVGLLPPLVTFTLSRKRLLSYVSLISGACFCIHINSTGISGNRTETYIYVCVLMCIFLLFGLLLVV